MEPILFSDGEMSNLAGRSDGRAHHPDRVLRELPNPLNLRYLLPACWRFIQKSPYWDEIGSTVAVAPGCFACQLRSLKGNPPRMQPHAARTSDARRSVDRQTAFARAERHSRRVRTLKVLLPALSVLGVVGFVGWSYLSVPFVEGVTVEGAAITDGKLVMNNPKMDGFTKDNLPYTMTAARAIQDLTNTSVIKLEDIDAKVPINAENTAKIVAASGVFDNAANTLLIDTPMKIVTSDGMTANLLSANVDIGSGSMTSPDPVEITMDGSRLAANTMQVADNGKVLVFEKRVRMHIDAGRMQAMGQSGDQNAGN